MTIPYFPHSGRRKHYWRVRPEGLRDLLIKHRWVLKGAYSEKFIRGRTIMLTTAREQEGVTIICLRDKNDFWADATATARSDEAEEGRHQFVVVGTPGQRGDGPVGDASPDKDSPQTDAHPNAGRATSSPAEVLSSIMQASLSKKPELAAKQRRLLQKLNSGTNSTPPAGSTNSAKTEPAKPQRPPEQTSSEQQSSEPGLFEALMEDNPGLTAERIQKDLDDFGG